MTNTQAISYNIRVAEFDGPFDLILFFVERDELDIYDIPIHKLCDDFLAYIKDMKEMDINLGAEFILVAATLMRIKARTLLPRKEVNELGEEIDPRAELVEKLLEYKRYKEILGDLRDMASTRSQQHAKASNPAELKGISEEFATEMEMESLNLFKIMKVFNKVIQKMEERNNAPRHEVVLFSFTIEEETQTLHTMLAHGEWIHFEEIFFTCQMKMQAIFRFLAMLDLVQQLKIELKVGEGINNCWIRYNDNLEASFIEAERLLAEKEGRQPNDFAKKPEKEEDNNENENNNENEKSSDSDNEDVVGLNEEE